MYFKILCEKVNEVFVKMIGVMVVELVSGEIVKQIFVLVVMVIDIIVGVFNNQLLLGIGCGVNLWNGLF